MDKMVIGGNLRWRERREGGGERERESDKKKLFIDSQNHKYDFKC